LENRCKKSKQEAIDLLNKINNLRQSAKKEFAENLDAVQQNTQREQLQYVYSYCKIKNSIVIKQ
jgi:hypothetical protein